MYYLMSYKRHAVHKTLTLAWALACKLQEPRLPLLILESLHMKEESLSGIIKVLKTISIVSSFIWNRVWFTIKITIFQSLIDTVLFIRRSNLNSNIYKYLGYIKTTIWPVIFLWQHLASTIHRSSKRWFLSHVSVSALLEYFKALLECTKLQTTLYT